MRDSRHHPHRVPAALRQGLALAAGERPLEWGSCHEGCTLVATSHGFWECPPSGQAVRHCWQATEVRCSGNMLQVRSKLEPSQCAHVMDVGSRLPALVQAMDSSSRLVELAFRLPSGTALLLRARSCRYESTIIWTSRCSPSTGADAEAEALMADSLLRRAKEEFGASGGVRPP